MNRFNVSITVYYTEKDPKKEVYTIEAENLEQAKRIVAKKYKGFSYHVNFVNEAMTALGGIK